MITQKIKIAIGCLLTVSIGFIFNACNKDTIKLEKKLNSVTLIYPMDQVEAGDFSKTVVKTNLIKSELEKLGLNIDNVKSIKAVVDSIVILNSDTPVMNFGYLNSAKFEFTGTGGKKHLLTKQDKFDQTTATTHIPVMESVIDWADLLEQKGDLTFTFSGNLRIKTPLKKDMKYCVSFYVSL